MARTLRRERRFTPRLRTAALHAVVEATPRSGARLLAAAIMPNHLHLVVQQGERPLSDLMQPLLRRLALLLQNTHGIEGPVFWRHYASRPCLDPAYARNAIVYTHLNPVRAGLCVDPSDYPWTSHLLYVGSEAGVPPELERLSEIMDTTLALPLFATGPVRATQHLREEYRRFVEWRQQADQLADAEDPDEADLAMPSRPASAWGDLEWGSAFSPLFHAPVRRGSRTGQVGPRDYAPDLASIARSTLAAEAPGLTLEMIRGRRGGREYSRIRHLIIRRLHAAGYPNVEIARFLHLSPSAVSRVLCLADPTH